jgi:hypothetical protein
MIDFSAPLAALDRASAQLDRAASQIAAQGPDPQSAVDLIQAKIGVEVATKMLKAQDQMAKGLIDLLP